MRYGSVCSGIEAATVAWDYLGWEPVFFSEIAPFQCSVLATRFPGVPNLGDMTGASLKDTDLRCATLEGVSLTGAHLDRVITDTEE